MRSSLLIYLVSIPILSCLAPSPATAYAQTFEQQPCLKKADSNSCFVVDASLNELSGIVAHTRESDVFWVHNDQGAPKVYAINHRGEILSTVSLDTMDFDDAEDISIGPGPEAGRSYIYVGDIGKSRKKPGKVKIFRFPEPSGDDLKNSTLSIHGAELIRLTYSQTKSRDFETQLLDPITGDLFLMEKDGLKVFRAKHADLMASREVLESGSIQLEKVRDSGGWVDNLSGGAVSPAGDEILIRNNAKAWLYVRRPGQTLDQALEKPGLEIKLGKEFNGEAITFDKQGLDFYTVSENIKKDRVVKTGPQPVSHYKRSN